MTPPQLMGNTNVASGEILSYFAKVHPKVRVFMLECSLECLKH